MVTAYNMQYILSRIDNHEDKRKIENHLEKYLQAQLRTMPRIIDPDSGLTERFASLQKLQTLLNDLSNQVAWVTAPIEPSRKKSHRSLKDLKNNVTNATQVFVKSVELDEPELKRGINS